jgi:REP element-mobilizing transposase RayT
VEFSGIQARAVGRGFATAIQKSGYRVYACSILPNHVHVVIAAHRHTPRRVLGHLKREATLCLVQENLHPFAKQFAAIGKLPTCWAERAWPVYLDTPADVRRAIKYVENNPEKEGKPRQHWPFVVPFER